MDDFSEMNAVYASYFSTIPPARETVQVSKLPLDVTIEISCIASKD
jgi:2-iminobutanoate/2-iminopropanoate deaminase